MDNVALKPVVLKQVKQVVLPPTSSRKLPRKSNVRRKMPSKMLIRRRKRLPIRSRKLKTMPLKKKRS